ncbi:unnamed protein product [Xylocopa violacea]|uniref:Secreted protein n=1 Tax=Xylocopa violacea TaxID=135666 RepID=A0ABP1N9C5_XYLVO
MRERRSKRLHLIFVLFLGESPEECNTIRCLVLEEPVKRHRAAGTLLATGQYLLPLNLVGPKISGGYRDRNSDTGSISSFDSFETGLPSNEHRNISRDRCPNNINSRCNI